MALPVTSAFVVVDLIPVANQETSPLAILGDAELKWLLCVKLEYCRMAGAGLPEVELYEDHQSAEDDIPYGADKPQRIPQGV